MGLPTPLRRFLVQSAFWTALCLGVELFCHFVLKWGYPYDYPALHNYTNFLDFHMFVEKFGYFHSADFYLKGPMLPYPATMLVAYKLFLTPQPATDRIVVPVYAAAMIVVSLLMLLPFRAALIRRGLRPRSASLFVLGTYAFSFAFWFDFLQGNIEFIVWGLLVLGIWAYWKNLFTLAAICFGIAGAMKIFPFVLVGLFVARKQYREFSISILTVVIASVVSLWLVDPNIVESARYTMQALAGFGNEYMKNMRPIEMGFDHSLLALIKRLIHYVPRPHDRTLVVSYIACAAIGGCLLFFLRIRKLPFINQVFCLSIAAILLPPVSFEYTLVHLYAPFAFLVLLVVECAKRSNSVPPGAAAALSLLAFLVSAQQEFIFHGLRFAGQLQCLALLALGYVACKYPFEDIGFSSRVSAPERKDYSMSPV